MEVHYDGSNSKVSCHSNRVRTHGSISVSKHYLSRFGEYPNESIDSNKIVNQAGLRIESNGLSPLHNEFFYSPAFNLPFRDKMNFRNDATASNFIDYNYLLHLFVIIITAILGLVLAWTIYSRVQSRTNFGDQLIIVQKTPKLMQRSERIGNKFANVSNLSELQRRELILSSLFQIKPWIADDIAVNPESTKGTRR